MGFLDNFGRSGKNKGISASATFRLTQEGRDKLQDFSGDPKSRILVALETRGTSNIEELSESSGVHRGQVERILPNLIKGGFVQPVGGMSAASSDGEDG